MNVGEVTVKKKYILKLATKVGSQDDGTYRLIPDIERCIIRTPVGADYYKTQAMFGHEFFKYIYLTTDTKFLIL